MTHADRPSSPPPSSTACEVCSGTGRTTWCPACGGQGSVGVMECYQRDCVDCGATGRVAEHACRACRVDAD